MTTTDTRAQATALLDEFWIADAEYRHEAGMHGTAERLTVAQERVLAAIEAGLGSTDSTVPTTDTRAALVERIWKLEDALAKRILADWNRTNRERGVPNNWPAQQEWDDLAPSSCATLRITARREAGISLDDPHLAAPPVSAAGEEPKDLAAMPNLEPTRRRTTDRHTGRARRRPGGGMTP